MWLSLKSIATCFPDFQLPLPVGSTFCEHFRIELSVLQGEADWSVFKSGTRFQSQGSYFEQMLLLRAEVLQSLTQINSACGHTATQYERKT